MGFAAVCGLLAGLSSIVDKVPYLRDTLAGSTRPQRATWLIWSVLATVVVASQRADGATWSLVMAGVQAALTTLVFTLSLRFGEGGLTRRDGLLLALAAVGVAAWLATSTAVLATVAVVASDLLGVLAMSPKAWRDPGSETPSAFALAGLSGLLAALAVARLDVARLLYPAYFAVVNSAIAAVIVLRRRAVRPAARGAGQWF
jgi:hypothetical protein